MKTKNNPWAAMDAIVNANPEPTGEEWFTSAAYALRYACTSHSARNRLSQMKEQGIVEQWKGRDKGGIIAKWRVKPVSGHS